MDSPSPLTRRTMLKASAGLAATFVTPAFVMLPIDASAAPEPDAEILAAYEVWRAAKNALVALPPDSASVEDDRCYQAILEAEALVLSFRPVTARGLAIQHVVFTAWGEFDATRSKTFDYQAHVFAMAGVEPDDWTKANPSGEAGGLE